MKPENVCPCDQTSVADRFLRAGQQLILDQYPPPLGAIWIIVKGRSKLASDQLIRAVRLPPIASDEVNEITYTWSELCHFFCYAFVSAPRIASTLESLKLKMMYVYL